MEKEWWRQPKNYPGILNRSYKLCGKCQCQHFDKDGVQCHEPIYTGDLCYYHKKVKEGRIIIERWSLDH